MKLPTVEVRRVGLEIQVRIALEVQADVTVGVAEVMVHITCCLAPLCENQEWQA